MAEIRTNNLVITSLAHYHKATSCAKPQTILDLYQRNTPVVTCGLITEKILRLITIRQVKVTTKLRRCQLQKRLYDNLAINLFFVICPLICGDQIINTLLLHIVTTV